MGLIELLTLLAVLVIALAMVVVTARHVRASSANELTRKRMRALVDATAVLIARGVDPTLALPATLPAMSGSANGSAAGGSAGEEGRDASANAAATLEAAAMLSPEGVAELREQQLRDFASRSSRELTRALAASPAQVGGAAGALAELGVGVGVSGPPDSVDAWDRPIALIPRPEPDIGMAPDDGPFFVSAGPDGRFLTLADNVNSYELGVFLPRPGQPATRPSGE